MRDTEKEACTGQGEAQSAILNFLPPDCKTIHFCYLSKKKKKKKRKRIKQSPQPLFPLCTKNPGSLAKCPLHLGDGRGPFWGKTAPEKSPPKQVFPMQSSQKPA